MRFPIQWKHSLSTCVLDTQDCSLLWDFTISTDTSVLHHHPDITFVDKKSSSMYLIDTVMPSDWYYTVLYQVTHEFLRRLWTINNANFKFWDFESVCHSEHCWCFWFNSQSFYLSLPFLLIPTFQRTALSKTTSILNYTCTWTFDCLFLLRMM